MSQPFFSKPSKKTFKQLKKQSKTSEIRIYLHKVTPSSFNNDWMSSTHLTRRLKSSFKDILKNYKTTDSKSMMYFYLS